MRGRYSRVHCNLIIRQMDHEINGLPKFTAYAFRVIAMNSKGLSPPAYTQTRTLEDCKFTLFCFQLNVVLVFK